MKCGLRETYNPGRIRIVGTSWLASSCEKRSRGNIQPGQNKNSGHLVFSIDAYPIDHVKHQVPYIRVLLPDPYPIDHVKHQVPYIRVLLPDPYPIDHALTHCFP